MSGLEKLANDIAPQGMDAVERKRSKRATKLIADYTRIYLQLGMLAGLAKPELAVVYMTGAEQRASELIDMASHHPKLLNNLELAIKGNDYIAFAVGHGSLVLATLIAFDVVPPLAEWPAMIKARLAKRKQPEAAPEMGQPIPQQFQHYTQQPGNNFGQQMNTSMFG